MSNEVTEPKFKSLMAAQKSYIGSISKGLESILGNIDPYQAACGYNMLTIINVALAKKNLNFTSPEIDKDSINNAIKYAMFYKLNADNKEVFVIIRNEKRGKKKIKDDYGRDKEVDNWISVIEFKPQYRGTLKIIADYGRDVKRVYPEWIVYETDDFKYPMYKGIEKIPPEWIQKGQGGKIARVVVPIMYKDGTVDYRIAERESVATNIKAQIKQSLMSKDDKTKEEIMAKITDMTLDELLADKNLSEYVNETYTGLSKDEMLITKLVLNAVKRVPIDYKNALARELNEKTFDNADVYKPHHNAEEVLSMSNAPMLDVKEVEADTFKAPIKTDEDGVVTRKAEPLDAHEGANESEPVGNTDDDFYSLFENQDDE